MIHVPATKERFMKLQGDLEALGYNEPLGIESLPLVERLFSDLVTTTQSYESLSDRAVKSEEELAVANNALYPLKKENARMMRENNKLHLELIRKAEQFDDGMKDWKDEVTKLKHALSDKEFQAKHHALTLGKCERELNALRRRCNELLQRNLVAEEIKSMSQLRLDESYVANQFRVANKDRDQAIMMTKLLTKLDDTDENLRPMNSLDNASQSSEMHKREKYSNKVHSVNANGNTFTSKVITQSNVNLAETLSEKVTTQEKYIDKLHKETKDLKAAVTARDHEISRLGNLVVEGGESNFDRKNLEQINYTNKQIVTQLNGQIDFLMEQLAELETSLKSTKESKKSIEDEVYTVKTRLQDVLSTNSRLTSEMKGMEAKVLNLEESRRAETARIFAASEIAASEVANVNEQLRVARETAQSREQLVESAESDRHRLAEILENYRSDKESYALTIEEITLKSERTQLENNQLQRRLSDMAREIETSYLSAGHLEEKVTSLENEISIYKDTISKLQVSEISGHTSLQALTRDAGELEQLNDNLYIDNKALAEELTKLSAENALLVKSTEELRRIEVKLTQDIEDMNKVHNKERITIKALEKECSNLKRESSIFTKKLQDQEELTTTAVTSRDDLYNEKEICLKKIESLQYDLKANEVELLRARELQIKSDADVSNLRPLEVLPTTVSALQHEVEKWRNQSGEHEAEILKLNRQLRYLQSTMKESGHKVSQLTEMVNDYKDMQVGYEKQIQKLNSQFEESEMKARTVMMDRDSLSRDLSLAVQDRDRNEQIQIEASRVSNQCDIDIQRKCAQIVTLEHKLASNESELHLSRAQIEKNHVELNAEIKHSNELKQALHVLEMKKRSLESTIESLQNEVRNLSHTTQLANDRATTSETERATLSTQVTELNSQLRQLKTLFTQLDVTREEMTSQLKNCYTKINEHKTTINELNNNLNVKDESVSNQLNETKRLHQIIQNLDEERDLLQRDVDNKTEEMMELQQEMKATTQSNETSKESIASLTQQLDSYVEALEGRDSEIQRLQQRLNFQSQELDEVKEIIDLRNGEVSALSEDLRSMTRENQSLSADTTSARTSLAAIHDQFQATVIRLKSVEQHAASLAVEKEDLIATYRAVCNERSRLDKGLSDLSTERNTVAEHLQQTSTELNKMRQSLEESDGMNTRLTTELRSYERQISDLSRQLNIANTELNTLKTHTGELVTDVHAARNLSSSMAATERELRLDGVAKSAEVDMLRRQLSEDQVQTSALRQQLVAERHRVNELEQLIAQVRLQGVAASPSSTGSRSNIATAEKMRDLSGPRSASTTTTSHSELKEKSSPRTVNISKSSPLKSLYRGYTMDVIDSKRDNNNNTNNNTSGSKWKKGSSLHDRMRGGGDSLSTQQQLLFETPTSVTSSGTSGSGSSLESVIETNEALRGQLRQVMNSVMYQSTTATPGPYDQLYRQPHSV